MEEPEEAHIATLTLPVRDWLTIDATLDNQASILSGNDEDDDQVGALSRIREIGWQLLPDWPPQAEGFQHWPGEGQLVTVPLTRAQWELIATTLEYWAGFADTPRSQEHPESMSEYAIADAIRRQLDQPPARP